MHMLVPAQILYDIPEAVAIPVFLSGQAPLKDSGCYFAHCCFIVGTVGL